MMSVTKSEKGGGHTWLQKQPARQPCAQCQRAMCADASRLHAGSRLPTGRRAFCREGGAWSKEDLWDSSGQFGRGGVMCSEGSK